MGGRAMNVIEAINHYTDYRINLGEKVRTLKYLLLGFGKHAGSHQSLERISEETCLSYLSLKGTRNGIATSYWFCIYSAINGLYQWATSRGYAGHCPLPKHKPREPEAFKPYIYTMEELNKIFEAALTYRKRFNIEYPIVIQTMLKVTCFLGLRPGETVNLHIDDIDQSNNLVIIRETKFYKSRMVPISEPVMKIIRDHLSWRSETVRDTKAAGNHLFMDKRGRHVKLTALQQAFRIICDKAHVHRTDTSRCDVRLQDLRHTFATNRVAQWYNEGLDVQGLLPALSTYLGHCNLDSTAVYITLTGNMLYEAGNKFKSYVDI